MSYVNSNMSFEEVINLIEGWEDSTIPVEIISRLLELWADKEEAIKNDAYEDGYKEGCNDGYDEGRDAGYEEGHEEGYDLARAEKNA